jgi:hypothetical protein
MVPMVLGILRVPRVQRRPDYADLAGATPDRCALCVRAARTSSACFTRGKSRYGCGLAELGGVSPAPVQMWQCRAKPRCRYRGWARPCHIRTGTGLATATWEAGPNAGRTYLRGTPARSRSPCSHAAVHTRPRARPCEPTLRGSARSGKAPPGANVEADAAQQGSRSTENARRQALRCGAACRLRTRPPVAAHRHCACEGRAAEPRTRHHTTWRTRQSLGQRNSLPLNWTPFGVDRNCILFSPAQPHLHRTSHICPGRSRDRRAARRQ